MAGFSQPRSVANRTIWLVRHGERRDFVDPTYSTTAGRPFDPPLSGRGHRQAEQLAEIFAHENLHHLIASPSLRTVQTAAPIARQSGLEINIEYGVGELLSHEWFSTAPTWLTRQELASTTKCMISDYRSAQVPIFPETLDEFFARCERATEEIQGSFPGTVLIVTHGACLVGLSRSLVGAGVQIRNDIGAIVKLTRGCGGWRVELPGDVSYLA